MTLTQIRWISFAVLAIVLTVVTLFASGAEVITWRIVLVFTLLSCLSSFLITNVVFRYLSKKR